jgi:hypothetical protein
MPTTTMTVRYVNPPKPGKQRGSIKGTDDQILGVFADKLHLFESGATYEIEYSETVSNGVTYRNVKSATPPQPYPRRSTLRQPTMAIARRRPSMPSACSSAPISPPSSGRAR